MPPDPGVTTLDYATPRPDPRPRVAVTFHVVLLLCGVCGVVANIYLIAGAYLGCRSAADAHAALVRDSRHYGREISAETIASLERPTGLHVAAAALAAAAAFGMLLALLLCVAVLTLNLNPEWSRRRLRTYARWKSVGIAATGLTFFVWMVVQGDFWSAATRHSALGPPTFLGPLLIVLGGIQPWALVRASLRRARVDAVA